MSQGPLYPNLSQKVQKEVSQMANRKLSCAMLYRWFKCKLKPPKNGLYRTVYGEVFILLRDRDRFKFPLDLNILTVSVSVSVLGSVKGPREEEVTNQRRFYFTKLTFHDSLQLSNVNSNFCVSEDKSSKYNYVSTCWELN